MEKCEWKGMVGNDDYQVSNYGDVLSKKYREPRILLHNIDNAGYHGVTICKDGKSKYNLVHRLVAEAFISNEHRKPEINHIDGDKSNNRSDNLEWVTSSENSLHAIREGLQKVKKGEECSYSKLTESDVIEIRRKYSDSKKETYNSLGNEYSVAPETIRDVVKLITWAHIKPEPELIIKQSGGTWVARYDGVDYLCIKPSFYSAFGSIDEMQDSVIINRGNWKPISEIEITDEIAKLRPLVLTGRNKEFLEKLWGVDGKECLTEKEDSNLFWSNRAVVRLATVEDLKND